MDIVPEPFPTKKRMVARTVAGTALLVALVIFCGWYFLAGPDLRKEPTMGAPSGGLSLEEERLRKHVSVLSEEIGSRSIEGGGGLDRAAAYIHGEFRSAGFYVVRQEYEAFGKRTANILANLPGFDPGKPILVLGAHYDTVAGTPGADDNASGVAVLIEIAGRIAARAPSGGSNLLFVAFSTEEPPAYGTRFMGSRVFVAGSEASNMKFRGALVLEMVGCFSDRPGSQDVPEGLEGMGIPETGDFITLVGDRRSADLAVWAKGHFDRSAPGLPAITFIEPVRHPAITGLTRLSDNASFWDAGIPALMVTDTAFLRNRNYHTRRDTAETLDYRRMNLLVRALSDALMQGSF